MLQEFRVPRKLRVDVAEFARREFAWREFSRHAFIEIIEKE